LTLTYYVEPQNMRRLSLPLGGVRVLLGAAGVSALWTLGSVVYLGIGAVQWLQEAPAAATASLAAAATSVEATARGAAPVSETQVATVAPELTIVPPQGEPAPVAEVEAPLADPPPMAAELEGAGEGPGDVELPTAAPAPPSEPVAETAAAPKDDAAPVAAPETRAGGDASAVVTVEQQQLVDDGRLLAARVRLVNKRSAAVTGEVWGVATFTTEGGETIQVESPRGKLSYKARKLTLKDLTFPYPKGAPAGRFTSVQVMVSAAGVEAPSIATYPVTAPVAR
jgi:hypothetical protein